MPKIITSVHKILYLDYDGVLHPEEVYRSPKRGIFLKTEGHTLFEWSPILEEIVLQHPHTRIVLSTSWVRQTDFNYARAQLPQSLQDLVIGATFHRRHMQKLEFDLMSRGEQIVADSFRRASLNSWVALDDDYLGWPTWCRNNLIATDGMLGLSDPIVQQALRNMLKH